MGAGDITQFDRRTQTGKCRELLDITFVRPACFCDWGNLPVCLLASICLTGVLWHCICTRVSFWKVVPVRMPLLEAPLLKKSFGRRHRGKPPPLTVEQILAWAKAHFERTGKWPNPFSGIVIDAPNETWQKIQSALYYGGRGLPGGRTLTQLLQESVGARNTCDLPPLTLEQVITWIRAHHERTGQWPDKTSGEILDAAGEKWAGVNHALSEGRRGLPGGSSIARILVTEFGIRNRGLLPNLTEEQIIRWAKLHKKRTGEWPKYRSGSVPGVPEVKWDLIDRDLKDGLRGLPGGTTLRGLLESCFGLPKAKNVGRLTVEQILKWASAASRLNSRVEPLQFNPCFVDRELPVDGSLLLVDAG